MMEEKQGKNFWLKIILAFACTLAIYAVGAVTGAGLGEAAKEAGAFAALAVLAVLALLLVFNAAATPIYKRSKDKMNVAEHQSYLAERKESAKKDLEKSVRKIKRIRVGIELYTVFLALLASAYAFLCGFSGETGTTLIGIYIFYGLFRRIRRVTEADFDGYSEEKDFPHIYALAKRAAKELGVEGEIKIDFLYDCNAGIAKIGKVNSLQIGAVLLDVLTEEELYSILLHEFAHLTKKCHPAGKELLLFDYIANTDDSFFSQFTNLLFKFPEHLFAWEFFIYRAVASSTIEAIADSAVLEHGDPQSAINGMAKIEYYNYFGNELHNFIPELFYETESPREDKLSIYIAALRRAIPARKEAWDAFLKNEIEPRSASHPIFRNRMAALGVSSYETVLPEGQSPYRLECAKVLAQADRELFDSAKETYEKEREEKYLAPMQKVEEWRKSGKNPPAEEARPLIDALATLSMYEELEALCDSLIEGTENKFALPHAYMNKGKLMLLRYDKGGIGYIYKAMEINHNYVEWGLDEIGSFCCKMGLEAELEEYRRRACEFAQDEKDKYGEAGSLSAGDKISDSDMPAELLAEILEFMKNADEKEQLRAVYLVKKTITDDFGTDAFLLVLRTDYDGEACTALYEKIFNFLDTHPTDRHFSLCIYDRSYDAVLKKAKNYVVFER